MILQKENSLHIVRFDSIEEQIQDVKEMECQGSWRDSFLRASSAFIGRSFRTTKEVLDTSVVYWEEGMDIYDKMMRELEEENIAPPNDIRRHGIWSEDCGDEIDLERLRRGRPYWRSSQRKHRPGPATLTLLTDLSTSAGVSAGKVLWRGAAAVCLTTLLERAGYRVALWSVNHAGRPYSREQGDILVTTCLKKAEDPLEVVGLVNSISGWFFRTITFASYHLTKKGIAGNYGFPKKITKEQWLHFCPDENVILFDRLWNRSEALDQIRTNIEKLEED